MAGKHRSMTDEEFRATDLEALSTATAAIESRDKMAKETNKGRQHRATYAKDKVKGGYIIRVEGPMANRFAGRKVPVVRKDNSESEEELDSLIWSGIDEETHNPVALYSFKPRPKGEDVEETPF